jgi:hypothetical protein
VKQSIPELVVASSQDMHETRLENWSVDEKMRLMPVVAGTKNDGY